MRSKHTNAQRTPASPTQAPSNESKFKWVGGAASDGVRSATATFNSENLYTNITANIIRITGPQT